jgi:hypothetical protein
LVGSIVSIAFALLSVVFVICVPAFNVYVFSDLTGAQSVPQYVFVVAAVAVVFISHHNSLSFSSSSCHSLLESSTGAQPVPQYAFAVAAVAVVAFVLIVGLVVADYHLHNQKWNIRYILLLTVYTVAVGALMSFVIGWNAIPLTTALCLVPALLVGAFTYFKVGLIVCFTCFLYQMLSFVSLMHVPRACVARWRIHVL